MLARKLLYKNFVCNQYGKDPDPYLWLTEPDADPGGPKT